MINRYDRILHRHFHNSRTYSVVTAVRVRDAAVPSPSRVMLHCPQAMTRWCRYWLKVQHRGVAVGTCAAE
jgi:hypothetical protein